MGRERKIFRKAFVVIGDIVCIFLGYIAAYRLRFGTLGGGSEIFPPSFLVLLFFGYLAVYYFSDLYSFPLHYRGAALFFQIALATVFAAAFISLLKYIFFLFPIGRGILLIANVLIVLFIFGWRHLGHAAFNILIKPQPVMIVGAGAAASAIGKIIEDRPQEFLLSGYIEDPAASVGSGAAVDGKKILGSAGDLQKIIAQREIDLIILSESAPQSELLTQGLLQAQLKAIEVVGFAEMYERLTGKISISHIDDENWFIKTKGFNVANNHVINRLKRSIDFLLAAIALIISLPAWPFIALLIRLDSKGPIFYSQERIGEKESIFSLYKFRSMIKGAEEVEPLWARENDPRITHVGRLLRRFHLDEIPQLWNILRGEMSLVGPRPERPEFVETLKKDIPYYSLRHFVKPGLSGWAQINYPYAASLADSQEKLEYDLYYISHMSLLLDANIILRTARNLLVGRPGRAKSASA